jgi:hypothetical protein
MKNIERAPFHILTLALFASACGTAGVAIPSKGTEAFDNGPWPTEEELPVVEMTVAQVDAIAEQSNLLCETSPDGIKVDHGALLDARSSLHTWAEPEGKTLEEILLAESLKLLSDSLAEMQGQVRIEKIGVRCVEEGAVIRLNDKALGPYEFLWGRPVSAAGTGMGYTFTTWSPETKEFVFLWVPNSTAMGTFLITELDRYIDVEDPRLEKFVGQGMMGFRFVAFDRENGEGWQLRYGTVDGRPALYLSKLRVVPGGE